MHESNEISDTLSRLLVDRGFSRAGSTFYKDLDELTAVVNLQRSQFGPQYYVNLAWYDPKLLGTIRPKEHHCHVRLRIAHLGGVNEDEAKRALDLHSAIDVGAREATIRALLDCACVFLERGGSIDGLRTMYSRGELRAAAILRDMRPRLMPDGGAVIG